MMVLVTGAASSGKSALAEELCLKLAGQLVYLATMRPYGAEGAARVSKHRLQRAGKGFETIERYSEFGSIADDERFNGSTVLLECLGNVAANELFGEGATTGADSTHWTDATSRICEQMVRGIEALGMCARHLVVVGNEVGCDGVLYQPETLQYQRVLGEVSQLVAKRCDIVVECVAGMPNVIKGTRAFHDLAGGVYGFSA